MTCYAIKPQGFFFTNKMICYSSLSNQLSLGTLPKETMIFPIFFLTCCPCGPPCSTLFLSVWVSQPRVLLRAVPGADVHLHLVLLEGLVLHVHVAARRVGKALLFPTFCRIFFFAVKLVVVQAEFLLHDKGAYLV